MAAMVLAVAIAAACAAAIAAMVATLSSVVVAMLVAVVIDLAGGGPQFEVAAGSVTVGMAPIVLGVAVPVAVVVSVPAEAAVVRKLWWRRGSFSDWLIAGEHCHQLARRKC